MCPQRLSPSSSRDDERACRPVGIHFRRNSRAKKKWGKSIFRPRSSLFFWVWGASGFNRYHQKRMKKTSPNHRTGDSIDADFDHQHFWAVVSGTICRRLYYACPFPNPGRWGTTTFPQFFPVFQATTPAWNYYRSVRDREQILASSSSNQLKNRNKPCLSRFGLKFIALITFSSSSSSFVV